ncbi:MAG TPA: hypothetical protein VHO90_01575 [Bacteroidales bacterium]|nr:hypothetical protein [Bacteroidales bacterium]
MKMLLTIIILFAALGICRCQNVTYVISYKDNDDSYELRAVYEEHLNPKLRRYIAEQIHLNDRNLTKKLAAGMNISLQDKTKLYLRLTPVQLWVKINKSQGTDSSYNNLKSMCKNLEDLISGLELTTTPKSLVSNRDMDESTVRIHRLSLYGSYQCINE